MIDQATFTLDRLAELHALPGITWRHDVDYDIECAVRMAAHEKLAGVQSTYYLRLRGDAYNAFDPRVRTAAAEIATMGHRIGLHVDLHLPRDRTVSQMALDSQCEADYWTLRDCLPMLERTVTFHAPPHDVLWRDVAGFDHAMAPHWKGRYVADSRGRFVERPEDKLDGGPLQCNLHSEWWFLPEPERTRLHEREMLAP